ncbi:MAG: response regulator [Deltaproteobacteria bacterium]
MPKARLIVIDDDPDIRDVLLLTLTEEGYDVLEASNGQEGVELIKSKNPNLVIVDYKMPVMDGPTMCATVKKDILLAHIPIIMLTGKGEVTDKVSGINAGADDYMVKPFEPTELLARIKMVLRRTERDLDANPLTHLPGNVSILNELQGRIDSKKPLAAAYADLDKFKAYNDKYGFGHGDEVIRETARLIIRTVGALGNPGDFIGHVGGDDFVFVSTPDKIDAICNKLVEEFEKMSPGFYNEEDRKAGYIAGKDRKGVEQRFGLLGISVCVVTNEHRPIDHVAQISEIGAELKEAAKSAERSAYVKDKRHGDRRGEDRPANPPQQ